MAAKKYLLIEKRNSNTLDKDYRLKRKRLDSFQSECSECLNDLSTSMTPAKGVIA